MKRTEEHKVYCAGLGGHAALKYLQFNWVHERRIIVVKCLIDWLID